MSRSVIALCGCEERQAAVKDGWLVYAPDREGWIFTDGPRRTMTPLAAYYAVERGIENHSGEPFVWVTCPFCGFDLATPAIDGKWSLNDDATDFDGSD